MRSALVARGASPENVLSRAAVVRDEAPDESHHVSVYLERVNGVDQFRWTGTDMESLLSSGGLVVRSLAAPPRTRHAPPAGGPCRKR